MQIYIAYDFSEKNHIIHERFRSSDSGLSSNLQQAII